MSAVEDILQRFHIPYVERGANVKRGNINVRCPFCQDDPSHHMGIIPDKGWYACWRDKGHRGKNFPRLLAALAQISYDRAKIVSGEYFSDWAQEGAFERAVKMMSEDEVVLKEKSSAPVNTSVAKHMKGFHRITSGDVLSRRHTAYLRGRGFDDVDLLAKRYDLMYAASGRYRDRVIIPYHFEAQIVTWSARSIHSAHETRYMALEDELSILTPKQMLYNRDRAMRSKGGSLFVVEGPFDCIKFDFYSRRIRGCAVVGLSSVAIEDVQLVQLIEMSDLFDRIVLMMDANELSKSMQMQGELGSKAVVFNWTEFGGSKKDPGQFDAKRVHRIATHYANN